ncbi:MAG: hypothetical protein PVG96_10915 [Desulfobacterales bacterium]|jgi:hypothetical protein
MLKAFNDDPSKSNIPWAPPDEWQAVNGSIRFHLERYPEDFKSVVSFAQSVKHHLQSIFPFLHELCADSCPWCPDPCCLKAGVWFDFKDLLFLHFNNQPIPPAQPKANLGMPCRYLGPKGCRMPRLTRPWICTWYLCPTQTAKLRNGQHEKHKLMSRAMAQIKSERNLLENEFIRIIT